MLGLLAMALTPALRTGSANETWRVRSLQVMSSFSPVDAIRGTVYRRGVAMPCMPHAATVDRRQNVGVSQLRETNLTSHKSTA